MYVCVQVERDCAENLCAWFVIEVNCVSELSVIILHILDAPLPKSIRLLD